MKFFLGLLFGFLFFLSPLRHGMCESSSPEFLSEKDFYKSLKEIEAGIQKADINESAQKIELSIIKDAQDLLKEFPKADEDFSFDSEDDFFLVRIDSVFQGDLLKAIQLYQDISIGKHSSSLFILSGAGKSEKISHLKKIRGGYEYTTDRVYSSSLAYNTRNRIRLIFYRLHPDLYIAVNEHILDYGSMLKKKGVQREGKEYGPIYFDLTIDMYKKVGPQSFQFISFNAYRGQTNETRFKSLNAVKTVGNIFTLGTLNKGLGELVKKSAKEVWTNRREHFQKIILE